MAGGRDGVTRTGVAVALVVGIAIAVVGAANSSRGATRRVTPARAVSATKLTDAEGAHRIPAGEPDAGRFFLLHEPRVTTTPRPLVLMLHGLGQTAAQIRWVSQVDGVADTDDFLVAYPQGIDDAWNAGDCCGGAGRDDVGFLTRVVAAVDALAPVDRSRVYVWGFSNGGMLAWRAVCQQPGVFAAAGVVAGALLVPCPAVVHVRHIHGAQDAAVPWQGGPSSIPGLTMPDSSLEAWRVPPGSTVLSTVLPHWPHSWPNAAGPAHLNTAAVLWAYDSKYRLPAKKTG